MKTFLLSLTALMLSSQLFAQQWEKIQYPEIYSKITRHPELMTNNNLIYALPITKSEPLYISFDNGTTWKVTDTNNFRTLTHDFRGIGRPRFTHTSTLMLFFNGILRSIDGGLTWQKIDFHSFVNNSLDTNILEMSAYYKTVIVKTGTQDNVNAYLSTDEGNTWKEMALPKNTFDGQLFKLYQNSIMYEGQFYDGKTLVRRPGQVNTTRMRFYLIPDIHNPLSQATSEFPVFIDYSSKNEYYESCNYLTIRGEYFSCDGGLTYADSNWVSITNIKPSPMYNVVNTATEKLLGVSYMGGNNDTPKGIYYLLTILRTTDSALLYRFVKVSNPYDSQLDLIADDFIVLKDSIKPKHYFLLAAVTDNAVIIRNNNNELYRFQKSSVSVEEQVFDATKTLTLQPNPAKEQIHISFDTPVSGIYTCELHDMMGASIAALGSATLDKGQQWNFDYDIQTLPNGYYRLSIKHQSQVFSVPCIIHK